MHFTWCSHGQGTVHVQWDRFALASAALATQASEGGASGVIRSGRVRLRRSGPRPTARLPAHARALAPGKETQCRCALHPGVGDSAYVPACVRTP